MVVGIGYASLVGDGTPEFRRELCKEVACRVVGHLGRSCVNSLHAAQHDKDCAYPCHDQADVFLCDLHNPTKLKKVIHHRWLWEESSTVPVIPMYYHFIGSTQIHGTPR